MASGSRFDHAEGETVVEVGAAVFGGGLEGGGEVGDGQINFLAFDVLHTEGGGFGLPKQKQQQRAGHAFSLPACGLDSR